MSKIAKPPPIGHNQPPPEPTRDPAPVAARTPMDIATDAVSSTLWGALTGLEVEMDGDLRAVGVTLDKTLEKFLGSIADSEGAATAELFAKRLRTTLQRFIKDFKEQQA